MGDPYNGFGRPIPFTATLTWSDCDADGDHALQHRGFGEVEAECHLGPLDDDELQGRASAPEQCRDGQRNLPQLVAPEQGEAVVEFVDQIERILLERLVIDAGIRHVEVEDSGDQIKDTDDGDGHFADGIDACVDQRKVESKQRLGNARGDEHAADDDAEDDGDDCQTLDPAVGDDQQAVRQVFGQDAVLGRRIGGGAKADDGVGEQWMNHEEHHGAADDLDRVADEHDPPLRHRVGEGADERSEDDIGDREEGLEQGFVRGRRIHFAQGGNGGDQQCVIGQRGKELRGHDDVEAERHVNSGLVVCFWSQVIPRNCD